MSGFTFFSENDIYNLSEQFHRFVLDVPAVITDLALLQGINYQREVNTMVNYGSWWLQDCNSSGMVKYVDEFGRFIKYTSITHPHCGARPVIKYSEIKSLCKDINSKFMGWKIVTCGEFPQFNPGYQVSSLLEKNYRSKHLRKLPFRYSNCENMFYNNEVYEFQGKKYIRFGSNKLDGNHYFRNNEVVVLDEPQWIEVMPIQFMVDEEDDIAVSKYILFSGMVYNYFVDNFNKSKPKQYLDNCFSKEIFGNVDLLNEVEPVDVLDTTEVVGDYDLSPVTEEDIIKGAIESDISVFLHGKSGDGKSARIRKLDPDCEIIFMRNATPDSLNGKSVYDGSAGKMIDVPPSWYTKVVNKCNSDPDKIHLVFFDELTNALPSMQGMAFNIILDREINGKWKLPDNARIVAAGNDLEESLAANKMAEPLFNRFAHVYIDTEVEDWLKWAMDEEEGKRLSYKEFEPEEKIHPDIISYIEYQSILGLNSLRTNFNGIKPNADPRKWEMASRMLYETKKPFMLRALIGEDLTDDFVSYLRRKNDNDIDNKNKVKRK